MTTKAIRETQMSISQLVASSKASASGRSSAPLDARAEVHAQNNLHKFVTERLPTLSELRERLLMGQGGSGGSAMPRSIALSEAERSLIRRGAAERCAVMPERNSLDRLLAGGGGGAASSLSAASPLSVRHVLDAGGMHSEDSSSSEASTPTPPATPPRGSTEQPQRGSIELGSLDLPRYRTSHVGPAPDARTCDGAGDSESRAGMSAVAHSALFRPTAEPAAAAGAASAHRTPHPGSHTSLGFCPDKRPAKGGDIWPGRLPGIAASACSDTLLSLTTQLNSIQGATRRAHDRAHVAGAALFRAQYARTAAINDRDYGAASPAPSSLPRISGGSSRASGTNVSVR